LVKEWLIFLLSFITSIGVVSFFLLIFAIIVLRKTEKKLNASLELAMLYLTEINKYTSLIFSMRHLNYDGYFELTLFEEDEKK